MDIKKLGEICTIVSGGTPSRTNTEFWDGGTIPWIKIGNIKEKHVSKADEYITQAGLDGSSAKMLSKGTILYTIFATLGEAGILTIDACTNQAIAGITIRNQNEVLTDYLYYYLKSKKSYVNNLGRGVAQNNINLSILRNLEVPLPDIPAQQQTVDVLDETVKVIKYRQQQLQKLDELVKARFVEMFGDYIKGRGKQLSELATITGGLTKSSKRDTFKLKMPYLRVANVFFNRLDLNEILEIGVREEEVEKTLLQTGDLLFVEGNGSIEQIGRVAIWDGSISPILHQNHLIKARFDDRTIIPEFALFYFMSEEGRQQIISKSVSTSGLNTLSVNKIGSLILPVPPIPLQEQFSAFVKQTDKSKAVIQKALDEAQVLFDSLMQKYFG